MPRSATAPERSTSGTGAVADRSARFRFCVGCAATLLGSGATGRSDPLGRLGLPFMALGGRGVPTRSHALSLPARRQTEPDGQVRSAKLSGESRNEAAEPPHRSLAHSSDLHLAAARHQTLLKDGLSLRIGRPQAIRLCSDVGFSGCEQVLERAYPGFHDGVVIDLAVCGTQQVAK